MTRKTTNVVLTHNEHPLAASAVLPYCWGGVHTYFLQSFFFTKKPACERGVRGGRSREMLFHIQSSGGWHSVHFATVQCYPLVLFYCSCTVAACVRRCILYNRNISKKKKTFILITCKISRFCTSPHIVAVRFMDRYSQDKSCISIVHDNVQMIQPAPSMYTNTLFKPPVRPPICRPSPSPPFQCLDKSQRNLSSLQSLALSLNGGSSQNTLTTKAQTLLAAMRSLQINW